jgi:hypothetical protein
LSASLVDVSEFIETIPVSFQAMLLNMHQANLSLFGSSVVKTRILLLLIVQTTNDKFAIVVDKVSLSENDFWS